MNDPDETEDSSRRNPRDRDRGSHISQTHRIAMAAHDLATPLASTEKLLRQGLDGRARPVRHSKIGAEPHLSSRLTQSVVKLPVLSPVELRAETTDGFEISLAENAKKDRFSRALWRIALMESAVTQTQLGGISHRHSLLKGSTSLRVHNPTDIGRASTLQQFDGDCDVFRAQLTVSVDAHDDVVLGYGHTKVQGLGSGPVGVVNHPNAIVSNSQILSYLSRTISAWGDSEDDFHRTRVALIKDSGNRLLEISLLVPDRYDNTDRRREV